MPVLFVLLADGVSEIVFPRVWPRSCAVVRAEMRVWNLDIKLSWLSVILNLA